MSVRQNGHWMITSTATGDDIHWVTPEPVQEGITARMVPSVFDVVYFDWDTAGDRIRPMSVVKKKVDHFKEEEDLFEI